MKWDSISSKKITQIRVLVPMGILDPNQNMWPCNKILMMEFIVVPYNGEKVQLDSKFILDRWIGISKLTHPLLKACIYLNLELFHLKGNPKFSCFFFSPLVEMEKWVDVDWFLISFMELESRGSGKVWGQCGCCLFEMVVRERWALGCGNRERKLEREMSCEWVFGEEPTPILLQWLHPNQQLNPPCEPPWTFLLPIQCWFDKNRKFVLIIYSNKLFKKFNHIKQ